MMSESFIYCLEKVTDSEIEQKTEALIGLEKLALNKEITSIYKTCDSIEGLEESIIELTKNDHNFINYDVIYFVLEGEENNIVIDDYCYSLQEIAELFEGRMTGKVLHFSNTKSLNIPNEEARYFLDVTGAKAISGYGEKIYDMALVIPLIEHDQGIRIGQYRTHTGRLFVWHIIANGAININ